MNATRRHLINRCVAVDGLTPKQAYEFTRPRPKRLYADRVRNKTPNTKQRKLKLMKKNIKFTTLFNAYLAEKRIDANVLNKNKSEG
jgi:HD superfamily phosphodiesterase